MIDINKYYLFCMGEGYLDKRRYSDDLGQEKMSQRVMQDNKDLAVLKAQLPRTREPEPLPDLSLYQNPNLFQKGILFFMKPIQMTMAFVKQMVQLPIQWIALLNAPAKGQLLERLVSQLFSFFFGGKKDKTEEEKEKRAKEDFNHEDVWGKRAVEGTNASGFSSGQR